MVNMKKQRGVALIVSLVFLIALTAVASALMLNTTSDMKMSGASQDKVIATQDAVSSIDEVISIQVQGATNAFAQDQFPVVVAVRASNTTTSINPANITGDKTLEPDCPASRLPSGSENMSCKVLRIQVNKLYGRSNTSSVQVNSGVLQYLIGT